jgi:hypothetical protein
MSLDDPDVLAGLSDGAPFFDNTITHGSGNPHNPSWGDGPTPRANPCDAPLANGDKGRQQQQVQGQGGNSSATTPAGLKELKEMWKQYMRTPLSGQPLAHDYPFGSPKRERGLSRVASLPSVKTPSATTAGWGDPMRGVNGNNLQLQPLPQQVAGTGNVPHAGQHAAYTRGHNHTDDLRSYEQAVLARRAPLTLHLAPPRRRGNTTSTDPTTKAVPPPEKASSASPVGSGSGSGSDRSGASSFMDERGSTSASPAPGLSAEDPTRPTFKRLPSQTLGPEYAKRLATTAVPRDEFDAVGAALREPDLPLLSRRGMAGSGHGLLMAERARRMSFPGGRTGIVGLQD